MNTAKNLLKQLLNDSIFPEGTSIEFCEDGQYRGLWDYLIYRVGAEDAAWICNEIGLPEVIDDNDVNS